VGAWELTVRLYVRGSSADPAAGKGLDKLYQ
jgi:hypothetical protein